MVDTGAVEYQHGPACAVLYVVDHHLADSDLHPGKLLRWAHRDNAAAAQPSGDEHR
jgi:hypothetical protein